MVSKPKTKTLRLDPQRKAHARKLTALLADGWRIVSESKRGLFQLYPGQVDYILMKDE